MNMVDTDAPDGRQENAERSPAVGAVLRVDHTHTHHQRRIARAIQGVLARITEPDEKVLTFTEGVQLGGLLDRAAHGALWPATHRVALVFTDHRLIEIALGFLGRHPQGRIRSFSWDRVPALRLRGRWLDMETWADVSFRWYLRSLVDGQVEELLRGQVDLAVSTFRSAAQRSVPFQHCGHCHAERPSSGGACRRCAMEPRLPRLAAWLAVGLPGGGHLYAGRWMAAAVHAVLEIGAYAVTAAAVLTADTLLHGVLAFVAGTIVLGFLKLQAVVSARLLAPRSAPAGPAAHRRWRLLAMATPLCAAALLVPPLTLVGAADRRISWDLVFLNPDHAWVGHRVQAADVGGGGQPGERSRWLGRDGLTVWVEARPFLAFEGVEAARARIRAEMDPGSQEVQVGPFHALRAIRDVGGSAEIRLTVIDPVGRDVHTLVAQVPAANAARDAREMERLLRRAIWIPAGAPPAPSPG
jgi:ribosomal protein L40E